MFACTQEYGPAGIITLCVGIPDCLLQQGSCGGLIASLSRPIKFLRNFIFQLNSEFPSVYKILFLKTEVEIRQIAEYTVIDLGTILIAW